MKLRQDDKELEPLEHWRIDCIGPFPKSELGNKYIISARCEISKLCALKALPSIGAAPTLTFIQERLVAPYGPITILGSDNGSEFKNGLLTVASERYDFKHEFITPGRSQCMFVVLPVFFLLSVFVF